MNVGLLLQGYYVYEVTGCLLLYWYSDCGVLIHRRRIYLGTDWMGVCGCGEAKSFLNWKTFSVN